MIVSVGNKVRYRGCFGYYPPETVTVVGIELTRNRREKYGTAVTSVDLDRDHAVFSLDNGGWAYDDQIDSVVSKERNPT